MRRNATLLLLTAFAAGIMVLGAPCLSQVGGSIRAMVQDENGAPLSGAIVSIIRLPVSRNGEGFSNCITD